MKDDAALKQALHLVVAAGGGERDYAVDGAILTGLRDAADPGAYLNERLQNDLRADPVPGPALEPARRQHRHRARVTGASRTFMGEESSGVDALRIAQARVASGQIDAILVGGSYSAERPDVLVIHEMGGYLARSPYRPVFERGGSGDGDTGFILGSCAAFLMLESEDHAAARGARALARLDRVASDRTRRTPGSVAGSLETLWPQAGLSAPDRVLSGATGVAPITAEEHATLRRLAPAARIRALGDVIGHGLEVVAPFGAALAAGLVAAGSAREVAVTTIAIAAAKACCVWFRPDRHPGPGRGRTPPGHPGLRGPGYLSDDAQLPSPSRFYCPG